MAAPAPAPVKNPLWVCLALLLALSGAPACAAELVGRVVDATNARIFAGAVVKLRAGGTDPRFATADANGFFRIQGLEPGAYLLDVSLPDGHDFVARLVLLQNRKSQFFELDYSRIVPPEDDAQY